MDGITFSLLSYKKYDVLHFFNQCFLDYYSILHNRDKNVFGLEDTEWEKAVWGLKVKGWASDKRMSESVSMYSWEQKKLMIGEESSWTLPVSYATISQCFHVQLCLSVFFLMRLVFDLFVAGSSKFSKRYLNTTTDNTSK